jgi:HSP20 family molecular chaperone IbpA
MTTKSKRGDDSMHRHRAGQLPWSDQMPVSAVLQGDELTFDVDLPGVSRDDVDVTVERDVLEVKAYRRLPQHDAGNRILEERRFGDWHRRLRVKSDDVTVLSVQMENGVLTVIVRIDKVSARSVAQGAEALIEVPTLEPEALYESLMESAATQVELLGQLKHATESTHRESVSLTTPTGELKYTLPLSRDKTYSSTDVGKILSPTGQPHRSIAKNRRQANELLGIKIANKYRYPKFQIDVERRAIIDVVRYANTRLECDADPWGTLDWWYSEDEALDDRRPVDLVENDELTTELVDFAIGIGQQSME